MAPPRSAPLRRFRPPDPQDPDALHEERRASRLRRLAGIEAIAVAQYSILRCRLAGDPWIAPLADLEEAHRAAFAILRRRLGLPSALHVVHEDPPPGGAEGWASRRDPEALHALSERERRWSREYAEALLSGALDGEDRAVILRAIYPAQRAHARRLEDLAASA